LVHFLGVVGGMMRTMVEAVVHFGLYTTAAVLRSLACTRQVHTHTRMGMHAIAQCDM